VKGVYLAFQTATAVFKERSGLAPDGETS